MMDKAFYAFLGVAGGFGLMAVIAANGINRDLGMNLVELRQLTAECESPLPRDQHCKIIAVKE